MRGVVRFGDFFSNGPGLSPFRLGQYQNGQNGPR